MSAEPIAFAREGAVGILRLDRPEKLNAMTEAMGAAIAALVPRINADPSLRCVIVHGAGRSFSAGGDLDFLEENSRREQNENTALMQRFYTRFLALREIDVPTIALLHGRATGAGLCLALACDIRLASVDALLSFNFVKVGLTPGMGGSWLLSRVVGEARALDLLLTGRTLSAYDAQALGLVGAVHEADRLYSEGLHVANRVAEGAPEAVSATKLLVRQALAISLEEALAAEAVAQARCFASADLREGLNAIRERRPPQFRGI